MEKNSLMRTSTKLLIESPLASQWAFNLSYKAPDTLIDLLVCLLLMTQAV